MKDKVRFNAGRGASALLPGKQRALPHAQPVQAPEITSALNQALAFQQAGLLAEAEQLYRKILQVRPRHFDCLHLLGVIHHCRGEYREAVRQIDLALRVNAKSAAAYNNRGVALKNLKRFDEALASFDKAIALKPDYVEAFNNRGDTLNELKRFDQALASCDQAIALKPDYAEAYSNRCISLNGLKRFDEALASGDRAIALKPDYADAFNNRGLALKNLRRFDEALADYDRASVLKTDCAEAFNNAGIVFVEKKRLDEALVLCSKSIALKPDYAEAYFARGTVLQELKRLDEALADYDKTISLKPDMDYLKGSHLHAKMHVCDWSNFNEDCLQLNAAVAAGIRASVPLAFVAIPSNSADQFKCAKTYAADRFPDFPVPLWQGERYSHQRIRVAYLSADLRNHPVAVLAAGLFECHDRSRFETIAISLGNDAPDQMRERLRTSFDQFFDVGIKKDQEIAELVRHLEIDIAVDLNGFTADARSNVFAQRPAPIQVNYLGYAGTLGHNCWDYIIADHFVIPEECREYYAEKVVYLPDSYMANDDGRKISSHTPSRQEAGLPDNGFVFCCFNNNFKITPNVFDIWMRLLREVEGSVLWLSAANSSVANNLRRAAERRGVSAERLIFAPRMELNEDHLARLRLAGLFLDTVYYNAHATASDALWVGLPVITCPGQAFASRVAGSLLSAVGLPELATPSLEDYEALALKLARDPALLAAVKEKLARQRATYPLFDTKRFTRHMESAYTTMWERYQRGEPPQSFAVAPLSLDRPIR
jgi:predicted O-linked N-acetylglucosamine transferase (SPINDLY family)